MKKPTFQTYSGFILTLFFSAYFSLLQAEVLRIEIASRTQILNGQSFGDYGAYELIKGKVFFGFDPQNPRNSQIVDLKLAPTNVDGLVEAWGDLVVLQPVELERSNGVALVEVSNRGGKFSPSYYNRASKSRELLPDDPDYWGDGLLMRQGLTVIWIGWQFDVPTHPHTLKLYVPKAINPDGSSIVGKVRSDWTLDAATDTLDLGHNGQIAYPALIDGKSELTVRDGRDAPKEIVPSDQWNFTAEAIQIYAAQGFIPGKIYELVYEAKDPAIVGLGLAAVRDIISYAKYDKNCPFPVQLGLAAGVSQTGRFLRTFLHQGFNADEQGRMAFDGLMIMTAGAGKGSFNHRFAQPSRDGHRYSAFFYPTDIYPFTLGVAPPRVFTINTGYEYWGRAASLIHTDTNGITDVTLAENERIYHLASGQHFVGDWPPTDQLPSNGPDLYRGNPLDFKVNYRALLIKLIEWVKDGKEPPSSQYPSIQDGTLVKKEALVFPGIPGIALPTTIHNAYRTDYGPRWEKEGIIDYQPPNLGYTYPSLVPQVDSLGNEIGGIRNVEIHVPLATYAPWNLRHGEKGGAHELTKSIGSFIPFSSSIGQKKAVGDPRPSIEELYKDEADFLVQVDQSAKTLVNQGFLLEEDIPYVLEKAQKRWDWNYRNPYEGLARGPENGSLIVIGGGRLDSVFYKKFMELAGGPKAPIVIIPTASSNEFTEKKEAMDYLEKRFRERGFKNITVLHTRDPKEADTDEFVAPLKKANGVWIPGGRQWRLVDSYLNTKTQDALKDLLHRGGVIAGSSAGATIQGSYLARGDSGGNTLMMGDHEEGFGFINNVAIDQHLLARNRQFDLFEILEHKPELLGIGLDENTGILVQGDQFEVMGKSYVAIYDGQKWSAERQAYFPLAEGVQKFYFLKAGDKYDLNKRQIVK